MPLSDRLVTVKEQKIGMAGAIITIIIVLTLIGIIIWLAVKKSGSSTTGSSSTGSSTTGSSSVDPSAPAQTNVPIPKPSETTKKYVCPANTTSVCKWETNSPTGNTCTANFSESGCFEQVAKQDCAKWGTWVELDFKNNPYTCGISPSVSAPSTASAPSTTSTTPPGSGMVAGCTWSGNLKTSKKITANFSTGTCDEQIAKTECQTKMSGKWMPLDYSSNPYTCEKIFKEAGKECTDGAECDTGKCEGGVCAIVKCGKDPYTGQPLPRCPSERCCSAYGYCGTTEEHCKSNPNTAWNG